MILRLIQSTFLLLYGAMIVWFYFTGRLAFLVNPVYDGLILTAGLLLLLMSFYHFFITFSFKEPQETLSFRFFPALFALMIPLFFAIFFKPQALSSQSAVLRGLTQNIGSSQGLSPVAFAKPPEERSIMEWTRLFNYDPEPDHYSGQSVSLEGSLILSEDLPENYVYIGRFLLTCCAADARSVVLPVRYKKEVFQPVTDQWVRLKGKLSKGNVAGHRQVVVEYESHENIEVPENPYAY